MKNILPSDDLTTDKVDESAVVVPINKEQKLIGQLINRNQPVWELDMLSGQITQAKIETVGELTGTIKRSVKTNENCLYCQSLNEKNAKKHFSRQIRTLVASKFGMWCRDDEWSQFTFEHKVKLLQTLMTA